MLVVGTSSDDILAGDSTNDVLAGLAGNDQLSGLGGDDTLIGGQGADTLDGGDGVDAASYFDSAAAVNVDLAAHTASGGDAAGDVLTGIEYLEGSAWNDHLTGDAGNNALLGLAGRDTLAGGDGDDLLDGGLGADTLDGGAGNDTVTYASSAEGIYVNLLSGNGGFGDANGDTLINVENLIGSDFADSMRGTDGANFLYGGGGNDLLLGQGGNDVLVGGAGDDRLQGGAGDDVLVGGAGADVMDGGGGSDTAVYADSAVGVYVNLSSGRGVFGDANGDVLVNVPNLVGSDFADTFRGDAGSNVLAGGGGNDLLIGMDGNDVLVGGAGADTLNGGSGADVFLYTAATDSGATADTRDVIQDFARGVDRIDLSAIDADPATAGDQAFTFIGGADFGGVAGQLRFFAEAGSLIVAADLDGDKTADFTIALGGGVTVLAATDFVL